MPSPIRSDSRSIVFALSDLRGGGAERVVVNLLNHWPRDHFRPILLLAERKGPYLSDLEPDVQVLSCDLPFRAASTPRALLRIRELLEKVEPAAVVAHSIGTSRMLARARLTGMFTAPLFAVVHNNIRNWLATRPSSPVVRRFVRHELGWVYSNSSRVIAVSEGAAKELGTIFPWRRVPVETIYNPVDLDRIDSATQKTPADRFLETFLGLKRPILVNVGRLSEEKNQKLLLTAFARVPRATRGSLVIFGEGALRSDLEVLASQLGVSNEVYLPGFVSNPWWYMSRSALYILSSKSEGYPMVLLEAMACGLPVVATNCEHGPSEVLRSESLGSLVPVNNPQALATAITLRLRNGPGHNAVYMRKFLEDFRPEKVAQRYIDLLSASYDFIEQS